MCECVGPGLSPFWSRLVQPLVLLNCMCFGCPLLISSLVVLVYIQCCFLHPVYAGPAGCGKSW